MVHISQESTAQVDHTFYCTNGINTARHRYDMFTTKDTTFQPPPTVRSLRRDNIRMFFKLPNKKKKDQWLLLSKDGDNFGIILVHFLGC